MANEFTPIQRVNEEVSDWECYTPQFYHTWFIPRCAIGEHCWLHSHTLEIAEIVLREEDTLT